MRPAGRMQAYPTGGPSGVSSDDSRDVRSSDGDSRDDSNHSDDNAVQVLFMQLMPSTFLQKSRIFSSFFRGLECL